MGRSRPRQTAVTLHYYRDLHVDDVLYRGHALYPDASMCCQLSESFGSLPAGREPKFNTVAGAEDCKRQALGVARTWLELQSR
jgi:hypothetical protein